MKRKGILVDILIKDKSYKEVRVSGHAFYDIHGRDIVCAGVSALTINTINSIEKLTTAKIYFESNEEFTILRILDDSDRDKVTLLLDSFCLGIKSIEEEYGKKHIILQRREV